MHVYLIHYGEHTNILVRRIDHCSRLHFIFVYGSLEITEKQIRSEVMEASPVIIFIYAWRMDKKKKKKEPSATRREPAKQLAGSSSQA